MIRYLLLFILSSTCLLAQDAQRIESEYKLAVPEAHAEDLWIYLQSDDLLSSLSSQLNLVTRASVEDFVDIYFDDANRQLYAQQIGLRHRSRYIADTLAKQLVQLKTPLQADGVARTETKYQVKRKQSKNDLFARHPLIRFIKKSDRPSLDYELSLYGVKSKLMDESVTMRQTRKRIYIADSIGALATITLDKVSQMEFPNLKYTEMELELNEIRFTQADQIGKQKMEQFNKQLKAALFAKFPELIQDQTPKYNKMMDMIDASPLAKIYRYRMWFILGLLSLYLVYLMFRNR